MALSVESWNGGWVVKGEMVLEICDSMKCWSVWNIAGIIEVEGKHQGYVATKSRIAIVCHERSYGSDGHLDIGRT